MCARKFVYMRIRGVAKWEWWRGVYCISPVRVINGTYELQIEGGGRGVRRRIDH